VRDGSWLNGSCDGRKSTPTRDAGRSQVNFKISANKMKIRTKLIPLITLALSFAIANSVSANFFQGFETDNNFWNLAPGQFTAVRVPSGTHGITSHTGSFHAEAPGPFQLCTTGGSAYTNYGGYSYQVPAGGWTTDIWVYLDIGATTVNDTRFDWIASSVSMPDCTFRRDFGFNFGWYNDSDDTGTGPRFVVSGNTNTGRCNSYPKNPGMGPFTITATGWYKLEGQFENNGGVLRVTLRVFDSGNNLLNTWVRSDPTDIIDTTVGGNRYGWFASNEFPFLAFDDSSLTGVQYICGSQGAGSPGYWMNHPEAWCEEEINVGGTTYTKAEAIDIMRHATNRDMTYQMFAQMVAAELNVDCLHSNNSCVSAEIATAASWLFEYTPGSGIRANSPEWKSMQSVYNTLADYNKGLLCAPPL
jgi:hypothetical protein